MLDLLPDKFWRWTVADGSYCKLAAGVSLIGLCLIVTPITQADTVKRWVDKEGRVHFSYQDGTQKTDAAKDSTAHAWIDPRGRKVYSDRSRQSIEAAQRRMLRLTQCMQGVTEIISGPVAPAATVGSGRVVLLTARWCAPSKKARAYLKKNKIKFVEYDIDRQKAGRILYTQLSRRGIPVIIAGSQRMFGFRADLAKDILQRSGHLLPPGNN